MEPTSYLTPSHALTPSHTLTPPHAHTRTPSYPHTLTPSSTLTPSHPRTLAPLRPHTPARTHSVRTQGSLSESERQRLDCVLDEIRETEHAYVAALRRCGCGLRVSSFLDGDFTRTRAGARVCVLGGWRGRGVEVERGSML